MKSLNENHALAALCLSMLMPSLDTSIANAALPALSQTFAASFQAVQWIILAYLLTITTLIVAAGRLGDLAGRRRLLLAGIALFTAASALCGMAPSFACLIAARALQGLGAAVMLALAMACVGDTVPKEKTGRAMGMLGTMSAIGTTIGPALGGLLLAGLGWRAIFLVNVPLGLLTFALVWRSLPQDRPGCQRAGFDHAGMLLLALSLAAYALAMTLGHGHFSAGNLLLLLMAACGGALFVWRQGKAASPLIRLGLFRHPPLRAGLIMSLLVAAVIMSTLVVGPFYLARGLGLPVARVGLILALGPLVAALWSMAAGRMTERFGIARMTLAGLGGMTAASMAFILLPPAWGAAGYILFVTAMTASYAQFQAANNTAMMNGIAPADRGVFSALLGLSRNLGLITGAAGLGAVFALASAPGFAAPSARALASATASGMHVTFAVASGLLLLALAIAASPNSHTRR